LEEWATSQSSMTEAKLQTCWQQGEIAKHKMVETESLRLVVSVAKKNTSSAMSPYWI
jgi:DNA-directed RNA polymerase sigma subunit (sigma70/sigma32)